MKTTSRFAMVAAAGLAMGGMTLSAKAADLGGGCCADLEQRVAELEATTARKGNRRVSLEVSGQVNRALLIWDDGIDSDAYFVDNSYSSSRFRFRGSATMKPGWKAGFLVEIELRDTASNAGITQGNDDVINEVSSSGSLRTRHANWYIESEKLGRVTVGQGNTATKDLVLINLGGSLSDADLYYNPNFRVRQTNGLNSVLWSDIASPLDGLRADVIRYDTPSIYGFIFSTAWGENDFWDIAVRFQKEWNSVRIAAGVGYSWDGERGSGREEWKGALSVMHVPTGIYGSFAGGTREDNATATRIAYDADYWYAQLGITKKWLSYGATTFYGEYGEYNDFGVGLASGAGTNLTSSEVTRWGFGVTQAFDSAALELYSQFHYYEADLARASGETSVAVPVEDWYGVVAGARIRF